ncbi:MAG TPA: hypothetical protein PLJ35_04055 [Anaerolineae bacterium]|nr:hypothetical protein [Anaerolineae bacterium]HOQ97976.1 hypothetical protein [Anaerolineae bacterium]HPL27482.1 hypothetical protein [Anaerolineae bacterium]
MKATGIALAAALGMGLAALMALLIVTSLLHRLAPLELGPFLLLLFLVYPAVAFLLGVAAGQLAARPWMVLLVTPLVFLVIVAVWYNETALVYIPAYTLASAMGLVASRLLRRLLRQAGRQEGGSRGVS